MATKKENGMTDTQKQEQGRKLASKLIYDFAQNTSLRGLKYIGDKSISRTERLFWAVAFLIFTVLSCILINRVWIKWNTSPIIISFNEHSTHIREVPFPSVTICPQTKSMESKFNFTRLMENIKALDGKNYSLTEKEKAYFIKGDDIALVCGDESFYTPVINRTYSNASLVYNLIEVAPTVNDTFIFCSWKNKRVNCEEIFKRVLTNDGVCYNFNGLSAAEMFRTDNIQHDYKYLETETKSRNWEARNGYTNLHIDSYPRRASANNAKPDLDIVLKESKIERDAMCNGMQSGFKVYIQHPAEMPQSSLYYYAVLRNQVSTLALEFTKTITSENLAHYPADTRQCYFPGDRTLQYFNLYNANNCMMECLSNYTFLYCGCVPFHLPHNDSRHTCTYQSYSCINDAYETISLDGSIHGPCNCYPDCNKISYDAEILKSEFNLAKYVGMYSQITNKVPYIDPKVAFSRIEVFFKIPRFPAVKRSELFGVTDFLSAIGGLLGLFIGFGFMTLVEIIYFISLRLCCEIKRETVNNHNH